MSSFFRFIMLDKGMLLIVGGVAMVKPIPKEEGLDHTIAWMNEGYLFLSNRMNQFNSDIIETKILGKKCIAMRGPEAAELFYDSSRFIRYGALPKKAASVIIGKNSVFHLDDGQHHKRKQMLLNVLNDEQQIQLEQISKNQWEIAIEQWKQKDEIVLLDELEQLFTITVCNWIGIPLYAKNVSLRTKDIRSMLTAFTNKGTNYFQGNQAKKRALKWISYIIRQVRTGRIHPKEKSPLYQIAWYEDSNGKLLSIPNAAEEVINIIRPFVAITRYACFSQLAILENKQVKHRLHKDSQYVDWFIQEVKRFYPAVPFVVAKARESFIWKDIYFPKNRLVLLDLYGSNHHQDTWEEPEKFVPERFQFLDKKDRYKLIPQGAGDLEFGHRCAGEGITTQMMRISLEYLLRLDYDVPDQDLNYKLNQVPAQPSSKIRLQNIRIKE